MAIHSKHESGFCIPPLACRSGSFRFLSEAPQTDTAGIGGGELRIIIKNIVKKLLIGLVIVLVILAGLGSVKMLQFKKLIAAGKAFVPPPETIASAVAREEKWQEGLSAIGSVVAVQGVTVT